MFADRQQKGLLSQKKNGRPAQTPDPVLKSLRMLGKENM